MVKKCEYENCTKKAVYALTYCNPLRCKQHKTDKMKYQKSICICGSAQPCFNYEGNIDAKYCSKCKKDTMIDIKHTKCKEKGCNTRPTYNYEGKKEVIYCSKHKKDMMVNIKSKKCKEIGCDILPAFNYVGNKKGIYCSKHKKDTMVNIISKRCKEIGCNIIPTFNYEGKKEPIYCAKHKKNTMIDILNKRCKEVGCATGRHYGLPGKSTEYCAQHKKEGMISNPNKKCYKKGCKEIAIYGLGKARACEVHKNDTDINLIERKCKSCTLLNILDKDLLCEYCNPNIYNKRRLAKQTRVKLHLDNYLKYKCISYDKRIDNGICGNERPDFLFESPAGSHFVILEVDEDQHYGRAEECECTRMVNISQSLGLPTIFIRYNPDEYKTNKIKHDPSFNDRMKILCLVLKTTIEFKPSQLKGFVIIRKLFFNDYKKTDSNYYNILDFDKEKSNSI